ncbi:DUF5906 domain-containing protein [Methylotenera versatilis]|uniref:DUF5906 domain-containing protein n=1 Tax=Methylotenera versatilis TaxID=1055487 RepID=UPI00068BC11B|nr:DUF5906 domain-containing protein [Methylotenera versatilis]
MALTKKQNIVKNSLIEHLEQVLKKIIPAAKFTGTESRIGDIHGNAGNSLSISLVGGKRGCWFDHATQESGNIIDFVAAHFDLNIKTDVEAVFGKVETTLAEIGKSGAPDNDKTQLNNDTTFVKVAEWDYLNADGTYICTTIRMEDSSGKKTIRPYNKETKEYKVPPEPRPLYNLVGIAKSELVALVEGEKCAQALIDAGYCATTAMMGANAPAAKTDWAPLKGKEVMIWRDNDNPGIVYAQNCAKAIIAAGAKSCTLLLIPEGKPVGWDVADALNENPELDIASISQLWGSENTTCNESNKLSDSKPTQSEITVEELNKTYAVVFMTGQTFVITEFINEKGRQDISLCRLGELKLKCANMRVVTTDLLGKQHDVSIIDAWMKDEKRRSYDGIVFSPQGASSAFYNLFRGFAIQAIKGDCSLYLQHLSDNICRGNTDYYEYLLSWMAHMIQRPWELPGVAIVFRGAQGTGKGVATDELGRLIEPHYITLSGIEQLVGRFTGHLKDVLLVYANEATWGGNKSAEGALKAMITDPDSSIEQKFKDVIRLGNYKRIMVSSNEDWAVPVGKDDRRFFILNVSNKHKEDHNYFGAIINQMRQGGSEALMYFLKKRDLSKFNVRKVPHTPFNFDLKLLSMDSTDSFIYEYLREASEDNWDCSVSKASLHKIYLDWCNDNGKKHKSIASVFGKQLKRTLPSLTECKKKPESYGPIPTIRQNHYIFSTLKTCRNEFENACKSDSTIWNL